MTNELVKECAKGLVVLGVVLLWAALILLAV